MRYNTLATGKKRSAPLLFFRPTMLFSLYSQIQFIGECGKMKVKLLKVLHVFGLDVLLLGLLEKLAASLTKKHKSLKTAMECFVCCRITATEEETQPIIA